LGTTRLITIDGPAGSGKTTLASELSVALGDAPIVHMDDLYGGWYQDLAFELAERIDAQIIQPILAGTFAQYQRYDWLRGEFSETVTLPSHDYLILEGVGSGHPLIRASSSVNVWIETDSLIGRERVINRDGHLVAAHIDSWQERERVYFAAHRVKESADFGLSTD